MWVEKLKKKKIEVEKLIFYFMYLECSLKKININFAGPSPIIS